MYKQVTLHSQVQRRLGARGLLKYAWPNHGLQAACRLQLAPSNSGAVTPLPRTSPLMWLLGISINSFREPEIENLALSTDRCPVEFVKSFSKQEKSQW
ncbi:hypothetical protein NPIL_139541 [Nephila pilipes]|uniref:Uncharacterized protein n=1 Tax=Nephila pilipes TaxID=299642 RepID=A0A8X6MKJ4_NEPPI|nr:hypothetical protein NPIL_139541 [Nephila pilipes]